MTAPRFVDTNILLYAYDLRAPEKRRIASEIVENGWRDFGSAIVSVQVLQEFLVNLQRQGASRDDATEIVRDLAGWPVISNTKELLIAALGEQKRWELSFWDASILAAARSSGAGELFSEDFNHGQDYGGVRVVNPFR